MTRSSTKNILFAVLVANSMIAGNAALADSIGRSSLSEEWKYSDLFPYEVADMKQRALNYREHLEREIRREQQRGNYREADRLIIEGRRKLQSFLSGLKVAAPSTTVITFGAGNRAERDRLSRDLRAKRKPAGGVYYINRNGGDFGTTPVRPNNTGQQRNNDIPDLRNPNDPNYADFIYGN